RTSEGAAAPFSTMKTRPARDAVYFPPDQSRNWNVTPKLFAPVSARVPTSQPPDVYVDHPLAFQSREVNSLADVGLPPLGVIVNGKSAGPGVGTTEALENSGSVASVKAAASLYVRSSAESKEARSGGLANAESRRAFSP